MFAYCSVVNDLHSHKVKKQLIAIRPPGFISGNRQWRESTVKMRVPATFLLLCAAACPLAAEPLDPAGIMQAVAGDWNKDGLEDLALLTRGSEDMNLLFFLRDKERNFLKPAGAAIGKVWGSLDPDGVYGQDPDIKAMPNGSLQVTTQNDSVGRDRWTQTLTIAYRNTDFIVAGFTYSYRDTLDLDASGDCDLNVLTGKGFANKPDGKGGQIRLQISAAPQFAPFKDWPDDGGMKECGIGE
jgi:hypothetical protein